MWISLTLLSESSLHISTFLISFSFKSESLAVDNVVEVFFFFISECYWWTGVLFSLLATKLCLGFKDILDFGVVDVTEHKLWLRVKLLLLPKGVTDLNGLPKTFLACEIEYKSAPFLLSKELYVPCSPVLPFSSIYLFNHWIVSRLSWYLAFESFSIYWF